MHEDGIGRYRFAWISTGAAALLFLLSGMTLAVNFPAWMIGYLLGLFAVLAHFLTILTSSELPWNRFQVRYFLGLPVRFLLVLSLFALLLVATNIEQIPFTLSFIISYIFHSVVDVILIHKILANGPI